MLICKVFRMSPTPQWCCEFITFLMYFCSKIQKTAHQIFWLWVPIFSHYPLPNLIHLSFHEKQRLNIILVHLEETLYPLLNHASKSLHFLSAVPHSRHHYKYKQWTTRMYHFNWATYKMISKVNKGWAHGSLGICIFLNLKEFSFHTQGAFFFDEGTGRTNGSL